MDFSRLPDIAFLKIFEYLSLEDCIRTSGVDKTFRRIAQLMISRTKSLDLNEDRFQKLTSDQLTVVLDLCSSNLERIKFPSRNPTIRNLNDWIRQSASLHLRDGQLASRFSNFECPRLTDIDIGRTPIDFPVFEQMIRNNSNIESLSWQRSFVGFPDITMNSLKKLNLRVFDDAALQSLIGQCPNLKEVDLTMGNIDADVLDQFFHSIPQVHHVNLCIVENDVTMRDIEFESDLGNFWNLPLTSLTISLPDNCFLGDEVLYKLAKSFQHLRHLYLDVDMPDSTSAGIAALAALKEMEILKLRIYDNVLGDQYDQGIRQLANCKNLQKLVVYALKMSGGTLINLLRSCPHLEHVVVREITGVAHPEEAAVILESLAGIPRRNINIDIRCRDLMTLKSIWEVEAVKEIIGKLENDGLNINVTLTEI